MSARRLLLAAFVTALASCAGDDPVTCGEGTELSGEYCVPATTMTDASVDAPSTFDADAARDAFVAETPEAAEDAFAPDDSDAATADEVETAPETSIETDAEVAETEVGAEAATEAEAAVDSESLDVFDAVDDGSGPIVCSGPSTFTTSGTRTLAGASDFVPLCGTQVAIADTAGTRIAIMDVATGTVTATHALESAPWALALDASRSLLYASLFPAPKLARISLATGTVVTIPLSAPAFAIAMGPDGKVLASATGTTGTSTLLVIDGVAGEEWATSSVLPHFAGLIAYSPLTHRVHIGQGGYSDSALVRYELDLSALSLTLEESIVTGPVRDLALSHDGTRIVVSAIDRRAAAYSVVDGEFHFATSAFVFSADDTLFGAGGDGALHVFDTTTHVRIATNKLTKCDGTYTRGHFARSGKVLLTLVGCYSGASEIDWLTVP